VCCSGVVDDVVGVGAAAELCNPIISAGVLQDIFNTLAGEAGRA
jgi:hypothetical protein